jgi:hypothetical protein
MELIGSVMNEMKDPIHEMESRPKDNNIRNEIDEQQKDETERK